MHTVLCPRSRLFYSNVDLSNSGVFAAQPDQSDGTLLRFNAPLNVGFITLDGPGFKRAWMLDDVGATLIERGIPAPFRAQYNLAFAQCSDGGTPVFVATISDRDPMRQNGFADVTVVP